MTNPEAADSERRFGDGTVSNSTNGNELETEFGLARIAQAIRELRKVRRDEFGLAVGEPAWDMLVELYYRDTVGASTTAAQLKEAAYTPESTADRWLQHLDREGLVKTKSHPDADLDFVELTDDAREALERYLARVRAVAVQQARSGPN